MQDRNLFVVALNHPALFNTLSMLTSGVVDILYVAFRPGLEQLPIDCNSKLQCQHER